MDARELAIFMHDRYEYRACECDWKTQEQCRVKFDDLPKENRAVMLKVAQDVLEKLGIKI